MPEHPAQQCLSRRRRRALQQSIVSWMPGSGCEMGLAHSEGWCAAQNPQRETIQTTRAGDACAHPLQNRYYDSFPTSPLRPGNLIEVPSLHQFGRAGYAQFVVNSSLPGRRGNPAHPGQHVAFSDVRSSRNEEAQAVWLTRDRTDPQVPAVSFLTALHCPKTPKPLLRMSLRCFFINRQIFNRTKEVSTFMADVNGGECGLGGVVRN